MNKATSSKAAALARIECEQYRWCDHYVGRITDLIDSGLITAEQVPGQPGLLKNCVTFYRGVMVAKYKKAPHTDEHYLQVQLRGRHNAAVNVGLSEADYERRGVEWAAEGEARRRLEAAAAERKQNAKAAQVELDAMPKSHDEFRAETVKNAELMLCWFDSISKPKRFHGFTYDDELTETLNELRGEILDALRYGTTHFDRARHEVIKTGWRSMMARGDDRFTTMLDAVCTADVGSLEVAHG